MKAILLVLISVVSATSETVAEQPLQCEITYVENFPYKKGEYEGQLCDGIPSGSGTITFQNGTFRKGTFVGGELHGEVITDYAGKAIAIGNFINGKEHGRFKINMSTGKEYEVFYRDGVKVEGISSTDMYISYLGERNDIGQKNGFGSGTYYNGDIYIGKWRVGKPDGYGILKWKDSNSFAIGEFKDGFRNGYGMTFTEGYSKYDGEWFEGKAEGQGIEYYIGGDIPEHMIGCFYKGEFWRGIPKGDLDCSKKDDIVFWEKINNTKPDLSKLQEKYPDYVQNCANWTKCLFPN